jgi:peptide/nickel transport system substrate-binding protein
MNRILTAFLTLALALGVTAAAQGDPIRTITLLTRPQAAAPQEFQSAHLVANAWRQLGLDVEVRVMPWEQLADVVWYERQVWDVTAWQMVGRPERSDPDEIVYNLFHSTTAETGFNFVGYNNPEYDDLVEAQRIATDLDERRRLIFEAQDVLNRDQVYAFLVYPESVYAFRSDVWDPATIVEQSGIGIKNTWTFIQADPLGAQRDMILNSNDPLQAINPLFISGAVDSWVTELIWDRLLRVGPDGLPQPWAAESFEWIDDVTIDVTLREGLTWHDGQPVTVDDVVFSFTVPQGDESPMYRPFVTAIAGVEALDDRTVRFTLSQPQAAFLTASLAKINLIPQHVWEPIIADLANRPENAESIQEDVPIGSGPFRFVRWRANEEVVLEANQDHFAAPKMDRWILRVIPNVEASLGMLRSGELNFLAAYPGDPEVLVQAAAGSPIEVVASTDIGFRFIAFNHRRPPFDDAAFRRALSLAINRDLIVQAAYNDFATPANSPVSVALGFWNNPAVANFETSLDLARQTLADAGYALVDGRLHYPDGVTETLGN